jgi:hypothetical protein
MLKYICKYINKGSDQATFAMTNTDEIQMYQSGRNICTSEAVWRIYKFTYQTNKGCYFQPDNVRERMEQGTALIALLSTNKYCVVILCYLFL